MAAPIWQRAVVAAQARLNPLLRSAIDQPDVAATIALLQNARHEVGRVAEAPTRRVLHLLNLPAGSDINRLLVQIAALERQVRELGKRLDDEGGPPPYTDDEADADDPGDEGGRS